MLAVQIRTYGAADVLEPVELPAPTPAGDEVLVQVVHASVNPVDLKIRSGAMAGDTPLAAPKVLGVEIGGIVAAVGSEVSDVAVGDEVFGWSTSGGYAQLATARTVVRRPASVAWDVVMSLPVAGEAALRTLDLLDLRAGETLLITGGAGAVGTIAAQLAVAAGVRVVATARTSDHEWLTSLGATPVLYGDGFADRVRDVTDRVDGVLDASGAGVLDAAVELRGARSRIVTIADPAAFGTDIPFSSGTAADQTKQVLERLLIAVAGGLQVRPARHLPLSEVVRAHRDLEAGGVAGKLVLDV